MLQFIRSRAQGVIAWIIVILIIIPFALWGVNQYVDGGKQPPAATVNGVEISPAQVDQAYRMQRDRLQQMFGENFRPELFPEERMRSQALDALIARELLLQAASGAGMRVADEQLAQNIASVKAFTKDGLFSDATYRSVLERQGWSPAYYEQMLRRDLLTAQLEQGISSSEFVTAAEQAMQRRLLNQKRDFGYMLLSLNERSKDVVLDEGAVQAYYDAHAENFMAPEQVAIEYVELELSEMKSAEVLSDEELQAQYEASKASYRKPEERRARHILIREDRERLDEVMQKLAEGGDFAELAKEYSEDPGSAKQGGDLGFFGLGVMDPAFEEATFALEPGQRSDAVKSAFGWHIIQLDEVKGGEQLAFAEVAEQIRAEIQNTRAEERYFDLAEKLANLSYEHPDSLEPVAAELGLTIKRSSLFSRGSADIIPEERVRNAAFSEEVKSEGNNSEAMELGDGHMLVLRVSESVPAQVRPLSEVSEDIETMLKTEKAEQELDALLVELQRALDEGASATELASANGVEWIPVEGARRDAKDLPGGLADTAFAMPRPVNEQPQSDSMLMANGDRALLQLTAVHEGEVSETEGESTQNELRNASTQAASVGFSLSLHSSAEISRK